MANEQMMENLLWNLIDENGTEVRTFEEAGVMTYDKGLVVKLQDGSEFQVTIKKSN